MSNKKQDIIDARMRATKAKLAGPKPDYTINKGVKDYDTIFFHCAMHADVKGKWGWITFQLHVLNYCLLTVVSWNNDANIVIYETLTFIHVKHACRDEVLVKKRSQH